MSSLSRIFGSFNRLGCILAKYVTRGIAWTIYIYIYIYIYKLYIYIYTYNLFSIVSGYNVAIEIFTL